MRVPLTVDEMKDMLLKLSSSQLTSHAATLVGIGLILFSYFNFLGALHYSQQAPIVFPPAYDKRFFEYLVIFAMFWILNLGLVFTSMRLAFYGSYLYEIIAFNETVQTLNDLNQKLSEKLLHRSFLFVPLTWFSSGIHVKSKGFWFSIILSGIVSGILFYAFFLK